MDIREPQFGNDFCDFELLHVFLAQGCLLWDHWVWTYSRHLTVTETQPLRKDDTHKS